MSPSRLLKWILMLFCLQSMDMVVIKAKLYPSGAGYYGLALTLYLGVALFLACWLYATRNKP